LSLDSLIFLTNLVCCSSEGSILSYKITGLSGFDSCSQSPLPTLVPKVHSRLLFPKSTLGTFTLTIQFHRLPYAPKQWEGRKGSSVVQKMK